MSILIISLLDNAWILKGKVTCLSLLGVKGLTNFGNQGIKVIAELAEHSPVIIQNSSNPSSQKNLDVRPYDHTRCYF